MARLFCPRAVTPTLMARLLCPRAVTLDSLAARTQPAVGVLRLGADVGPGAASFSAWPVLRGILPGV